MSVSEERPSEDTAQETGPVFFRTILRREVYERLKTLAQQYETGRGDWDFGVAIQILLDNYDSSKVQSVNERLDFMLSIMQSQAEAEEPVKEHKFMEMLGKHKIDLGEKDE